MLVEEGVYNENKECKLRKYLVNREIWIRNKWTSLFIGRPLVTSPCFVCQTLLTQIIKTIIVCFQVIVVGMDQRWENKMILIPSFGFQQPAPTKTDFTQLSKIWFHTASIWYLYREAETVESKPRSCRVKTATDKGISTIVLASFVRSRERSTRRLLKMYVCPLYEFFIPRNLIYRTNYQVNNFVYVENHPHSH